jgi:hypothetical protein
MVIINISLKNFIFFKDNTMKWITLFFKNQIYLIRIYRILNVKNVLNLFGTTLLNIT